MTAIDPYTLRPHYSAFLREGRILLTGHSHQAWPNAAREGQLRAWEDAAELVDDKWERAFEVADQVRAAIAKRIGAHQDEIALGSSTHELVTRFLSALDLRARPHLVTTSGEFHSMHRQLMRLAEAGATIDAVPWHPVDTLAQRMAEKVRDDTAALLASTVLFESSTVVPHLRVAIEAAHRRGAAVLLDAYHAFGVLPFTLDELGPDPIFVTAGGYKYAQWGEGNCFLRVPPDSDMRPIYTGWFSDFAHLAEMRSAGTIGYGTRGADRFAGSTYDPTSHYRADAVIEFFEQHELGLPRLRALSLSQTARILEQLEDFDVLTPREDRARAGFVALRVPNANHVVRALRERGVYTDARADVLRLGPAPYITEDEIDAAVAHLRQIVRPR